MNNCHWRQCETICNGFWNRQIKWTAVNTLMIPSINSMSAKESSHLLTYQKWGTLDNVIIWNNFCLYNMCCNITSDLLQNYKYSSDKKLSFSILFRGTARHTMEETVLKLGNQTHCRLTTKIFLKCANNMQFC